MQEERWIKHYSNFQKILLIGEGDFSFSACLANAFGSAANMVATSLDNKDDHFRPPVAVHLCFISMVLDKHSTAKANLETLHMLDCTIGHKVDAHSMRKHPLLKTRRFDRIVFNFPHAGFLYRVRGEHDEYQIQLHQEVVRGFLQSARHMLTKNGEIHVTHKTSNPFSKWEVQKLAQEAGLCLVEEVLFSKADYPGYHNKKGYGRKTNKTFHVGECSTFKFTALTSV
ncbi:hypothetical protein IFM89_022986 [Coptis chinensis]|uniref:25S rRNA (uridine-N(3))-methyltransferase BMT5-like domain-containing protein n=1 Tax=Coptis chinensis TaxID=261450 RepID=A0A835IAJ6_9MAGN|nr:hypothetical protein IFM89_022986 [Coptis chinensis]